MDEEIIKAIQAGGQKLEHALLQLYKDQTLKNWVMNHVTQRGGSREDGEEIFQDGLIQLSKAISNKKFKGESTIKTYLSGICKKLWLNLYRKNQSYSNLKENAPQEQILLDSPEDVIIYKENANLLSDILDLLGEKCRQVLELANLGYSMKEIAKEVGYKSENMVSKKRNHCKKSLTALLKARPELIEKLK